MTFPGDVRWAQSGAAERLVVHRGRPDNHFATVGDIVASLPEGDYARRFRSCAVVGNAGVLLLSEFGGAIDAHECIIRFNDGPSAGFERFAGSRTDIRIVNNNWSRQFAHKSPKGLTQSALILFGEGSARSLKETVRSHAGEEVYFLSPEFAAMARRQYKRAYAAVQQQGVITVHGRNSAPTGVEGIFFALAVCGTVHLYGFGVEPVDAPYHYHDKVKGVEAAHSFGFQAVFLKLLQAGERVRLCVPGHATSDCSATTQH